jgi:hypothetical protein
LAVGGFRVGAPPAAVTASDPGVILESPTGQKPPPKKDSQPDEKKPPPQTKKYESLFLPSQKQLFRLESEKALRERVKREIKGELGEFPDSTIVLSKTPYVKRYWDPLAEVVEPYYTVYRRLYFEQINAERYGWDFGYMHPLIATGTFYWDFATLPFQFIADPCRRYEYNSGYCLPGDPVPLLLYPPHPK